MITGFGLSGNQAIQTGMTHSSGPRSPKLKILSTSVENKTLEIINVLLVSLVRQNGAQNAVWKFLHT